MSESFVPRDAGSLRSRLAQNLPVSVWSHWRIYATGVVVVLAALAWLFEPGGHTAGPSRPEDALPRATATATATPTATATATPTAPQVAQLVVQVAGAVTKPGVVHLGANARVGDAVEAAGGLSANADIERTNLAAKVSDGQRVYVIARGQPAPPPTSAGQDVSDEAAPVDLNASSADALDKLPGVGPATARAIVEYRAAHGPFHSVSDLAKVKGIGPAKLEQIKPLVQV